MRRGFCLGKWRSPGGNEDRDWSLPTQWLAQFGAKVALVFRDVVDVSFLKVVVLDEGGKVAGDFDSDRNVGEELIPPAFVGVCDAVAIEIDQLAFGGVTQASRGNACDDISVVDKAEGLAFETMMASSLPAMNPSVSLVSKV